MLATPEFWVFIAFLLLIGAAGKRAFIYLTRSFDQHSKKIAQHLEEAQHLHDEAFSLLTSYKQKQQEAFKQAEQISAFAEKEILAFKQSSEQEFEKFIAHKEKELLERIQIEKEEAKSKLRKEAMDEALALVESFLAAHPREKATLTKSALKEVTKLSAKAKN